MRCFAGQPGQLTPPHNFARRCSGPHVAESKRGPADPTTTWPVPTTVHLLRSSSMPVHACNAMRCVAMRASCQWSYRIANCCCVSLQILKTRQLHVNASVFRGSFFLTADLSCMAWRGLLGTLDDQLCSAAPPCFRGLPGSAFLKSGNSRFL